MVDARPKAGPNIQRRVFLQKGLFTTFPASANLSGALQSCPKPSTRCVELSWKPTSLPADSERHRVCRGTGSLPILEKLSIKWKT